MSKIGNTDLLFPITINGFYGKNHKIHLGFGQLITTKYTGESYQWNSKKGNELSHEFCYWLPLSKR